MLLEAQSVSMILRPTTFWLTFYMSFILCLNIESWPWICLMPLLGIPVWLKKIYNMVSSFLPKYNVGHLSSKELCELVLGKTQFRDIEFLEKIHLTKTCPIFVGSQISYFTRCQNILWKCLFGCKILQVNCLTIKLHYLALDDLDQIFLKKLSKRNLKVP